MSSFNAAPNALMGPALGYHSNTVERHTHSAMVPHLSAARGEPMGARAAPHLSHMRGVIDRCAERTVEDIPHAHHTYDPSPTAPPRRWWGSFVCQAVRVFFFPFLDGRGLKHGSIRIDSGGRCGIRSHWRWQRFARRRIRRGGSVCVTRGTSGRHRAATPIPHAWLHWVMRRAL